jgi:uncharacterized protein (TIGR03000 family)
MAAAPNQATVVVQVPESAQLYVDDHRVTQTSATRTFVTPALQPGTTYYYNLRAESVRDGKTVAATKRVTVRAGETTRVAFTDTDTASAGVSTRITVRLPANAKLFVDGVAVPTTSGTRTFDTPRLTPGHQYSYNMRAELVRDGRTRTEDKRVVFTPGEAVTVDFSDLPTLTTASR